MIKQSILILVLGFLTLLSCKRTPSPSPEPLSSPAAPGSQLPRLVSDAGGHLFMSWVETDTSDENNAILRFSGLKEHSWTPPQTISQGNDWFVNWADFPSLTVASGQPRSAHWLQKVPGNTYSYHVRVSVSRENESWSSPITPHSDNTATEHGFVSMIPWMDESTLAIWLDGRQTVNRKEGEYFNMGKAMTLRAAVISENGSVSDRTLIDDIVCDCCQTALVRTPYGALAAYRDRAENEIRDIYISRYQTGGSWSKPEVVHHDGWEIGACPVNGPALAVSDSVAVVAWYTGTNNQRRVKASISTDAGYTFSDPIVIDSENPIGRVDAAVSSEGTVFVSWVRQTSDDEKAELRVRALSMAGERNDSILITSMNSSRRSGFPQMELQGDRLVFAWTDLSDVPQVKVASLSFGIRD